MRLWLALIAAAAAGLAVAQDAAVKSQQAGALMQQRQYARAALIYEELAKAMPLNAGLWLNVGLARFQGAEFEKAGPALETAVKLNPRLAPAQMMLGLCRLKMGEAARAVAPLQTAARLDPANELARSELASAYLEAGRHDEAAAAFAALPGNKALLGRGYALLGIAEASAAELERRAPASAWRLSLRARALQAQGSGEEAQELARQAQAKSPGVPGLASPEDPARDWPKLLADRRPLAEPLYWRALAANALATETLTKLAGTPEAVELEAEALRAQGKHREAAEKWKAACERSPNDARLRKRQAQAHWQAGEFDAAGQALAGLAEDGDVLFLLGDLAQRREDTAGARAFWERGVQRSPGAKPMQAALGKLLLEAGESAAAIRHLEAARGLEPAVLFQLSRAYTATGRKQAAAQALREFQLQQTKPE